MPTIIEELELPGEAETIEELPLPRKGNRLVTGLKRLVGREEPIEELPLPRRQPYEDRFPVVDGLTPEERAKRETWGGLTEAEKLQTDVARIGREGMRATGGVVKGLGLMGQAMRNERRKVLEELRDDPRELREVRAMAARQLAQMNADEDALPPEKINPALAGGAALQGAAERTFPDVVPGDETRLIGAVGGAAASTVPYLAAAPLGAPGVVLLGAAGVGSEGYDDAKAAGADEATAMASFALNALTGTSEAVPLVRILQRIDRASRGQLRTAVKGILTSAGEEAAQETFQQAAGNVVAAHLYDEERDYLAGLAEAAGLGGGAGAVISALGIGTRRAARRVAAVERLGRQKAGGRGTGDGSQMPEAGSQMPDDFPPGAEAGAAEVIEELPVPPKSEISQMAPAAQAPSGSVGTSAVTPTAEAAASGSSMTAAADEPLPPPEEAPASKADLVDLAQWLVKNQIVGAGAVGQQQNAGAASQSDGRGASGQQPSLPETPAAPAPVSPQGEAEAEGPPQAGLETGAPAEGKTGAPTALKRASGTLSLRQRMSADDLTRMLAGYKVVDIGLENGLAQQLRAGGDLTGIRAEALLDDLAGADIDNPEIAPHVPTIAGLLKAGGWTHVETALGDRITVAKYLADLQEQADQFGMAERTMLLAGPRAIDIEATVELQGEAEAEGTPQAGLETGAPAGAEAGAPAAVQAAVLKQQLTGKKKAAKAGVRQSVTSTAGTVASEPRPTQNTQEQDGSPSTAETMPGSSIAAAAGANPAQPGGTYFWRRLADAFRATGRQPNKKALGRWLAAVGATGNEANREELSKAIAAAERREAPPERPQEAPDWYRNRKPDFTALAEFFAGTKAAVTTGNLEKFLARAGVHTKGANIQAMRQALEATAQDRSDRAADRAANKVELSSITPEDGLLYTIVGQIGQLPAFVPDGLALGQYKRLRNRQAGGGVLTSKEKAQLERLRDIFPANLEDTLGVDGSANRNAYEAAKRAGIAHELFRVVKRAPTDMDVLLDDVQQASGKEFGAVEFWGEIEQLAEAHRARRGEGSREEEHYRELVEQQEKFLSDNAVEKPHASYIMPEQLAEGDSYTLDGVKLRVDDILWDEDGNVVQVRLENGKTYGTVTVSGQTALRMDPDSLERGEQGEAGQELREDFALYGAESVEEQKARAKREAAERKAKEELAARRTRRLTGKDLDTTKEMFGGAEGRATRTDASGQGALFERPAALDGREEELDRIARDLYGRAYDDLSEFDRGNVEVTLEAEDTDAALRRREQPANPAGRQRDPAGEPARPPADAGRTAGPVQHTPAETTALAQAGALDTPLTGIATRLLAWLNARPQWRLAQENEAVALARAQRRPDGGVDWRKTSTRLLDIIFAGERARQREQQGLMALLNEGSIRYADREGRENLEREIEVSAAQDIAKRFWPEIAARVTVPMRIHGRLATAADQAEYWAGGSGLQEGPLIARTMPDGSRFVYATGQAGLETGAPGGGVRVGNAVLTPPGATGANLELRDLEAHHGTPHKVDRFSTAKIGTGEGAQVYGWGLYFAENPAVAEQYRNQLAPYGKLRGRDGKEIDVPSLPDGATKIAAQLLMREPDPAKARFAAHNLRLPEGVSTQAVLDEISKLEGAAPAANIYTVTLKVEPEELLDWDRPLSEQSEKVQQALQPLLENPIQANQYPSTQQALRRFETKAVLAAARSDIGIRAALKRGFELAQAGDEAGFRTWFAESGGHLFPERRLDIKGESFYQSLANREYTRKPPEQRGEWKDSARLASEALSRAGIKGIRYLDQGSRRVDAPVVRKSERSDRWVVSWVDAAGINNNRSFETEAEAREFKKSIPDQQTYNYVMFDESRIEITRENGQPVSVAQALREMGAGNYGDAVERVPTDYSQLDSGAVAGVALTYGTTEKAAREALADTQPYQQTLEFDAPGGGAVRPDAAPTNVSRPAPGDGAALNRTATAADRNAALAERGRISRIIPDRVENGLPRYDIAGTVLNTPGDFVATLIGIRSPYQETLKIAIVDDEARVIHSQILYAGSLDTISVDSRDFVRLAERFALRLNGGKLRLLMAHNHPGGDPSPSAADYAVTRRLQEMAAAAGFEILDHVITNGKRYWSFKGQTFEAVEEPKLAPWETIAAEDMQMMLGSDDMGRLVESLRQGNQNRGHIIYLNTRNLVTAIEQVSAGPMGPQAIKRLLGGIGREGALSVLIDFGPAYDVDDAVAQTIMLNMALRQGGTTTRVIDVAARGTLSARSVGHKLADGRDEKKPGAQEAGQGLREGGELGVSDYMPALRRRGVKGDALLNAQDLAAELTAKGAPIDAQGRARLYHRTTPAAAARIAETGQMVGKEDGLFFGTSPTGQIEGYGEAAVEVWLPLEKLELNDVFPSEAHVRMPTGAIGKPVAVGKAAVWTAEGTGQAGLETGAPWSWTREEFDRKTWVHFDVREDAAARVEQMMQGMTSGWVGPDIDVRNRAGIAQRAPARGWATANYMDKPGAHAYVIAAADVQSSRTRPPRVKAGTRPLAHVVLTRAVQSVHEALVEQAMAEGRPVPEKVLREYPALRQAGGDALREDAPAYGTGPVLAGRNNPLARAELDRMEAALPDMVKAAEASGDWAAVTALHARANELMNSDLPVGEAAATAPDLWRNLSPEERGEAISRTVDMLNAALTEISFYKANGKPLPAALKKLRDDMQVRLLALKGWADESRSGGEGAPAGKPKPAASAQSVRVASAAHGPGLRETWWESLKRALRYVASPTPEIPLTGDAAEKAARFIRGFRKFAVETDAVRREAVAKIAGVVGPVTRARSRDTNADDRRFYKLGREIERANAQGDYRREEQLQAQLERLDARLEGDPFHLFRKFVLFSDLYWRARNLQGPDGKDFKLPLDMTLETVQADLARLQAKIDAHPRAKDIKESLKRHYALVDELQKSIIEHGELIPDMLRNPLYFPHHLLDHWKGRLDEVRPSTEEDFRRYLITPIGSTKLIQADYLKAMYVHTADVLAHNKRVDLVEQYWKPYDIGPKLREEFGDDFSKPWNIPAGHVVWHPYQKIPLRMDYILPASILAEKLGLTLDDGNLKALWSEAGLKLDVRPEDLREALVAGERIKWVLPVEIAEALDGITRREAQRHNTGVGHALGMPAEKLVGFWKRVKLFAPWNWVRYEYGNLLTDVGDKVFAADPGVTRMLGRAAAEVRAVAGGAAPSQEYVAAEREGVFETITSMEVRSGEDVLDAAPLANLRTTGETARAGARAMIGATAKGSHYREATFRYAKFLADVERMRAGQPPIYAGAYHGNIEALTGTEPTSDAEIYAKAAEISLKTFGDYRSLGVAGQWLRRYAIPFHSWTDVNFRYHANLLRNIADGMAGKGGADGKTALRWAAWRITMTLAGMAIMQEAWNQFGGPLLGLWDDDDDLEANLSPHDRRRAHILLGKDAEGKTLVVHTPSALGDIAEWIGGNKLKQVTMDLLRGNTTFGEAAAEYATEAPADLLNKVVSSSTPLAKAVYEGASGKATFPDVLDQRTIPPSDRPWRLAGQLFDDRALNAVRAVVDKDFYGQPLGEQMMQIIAQVRRRDPEQWAYYSAREKVGDWKLARTGQRYTAGEYDAPEAQALRSYRRALYRGDLEAAERLRQRLLEYGYTQERFAASLRAQHPLSDLNRAEKAEYVDALSERDLAELRRALAYYERIASVRGEDVTAFPKKGR